MFIKPDTNTVNHLLFASVIFTFCFNVSHFRPKKKYVCLLSHAEKN